MVYILLLRTRNVSTMSDTLPDASAQAWSVTKYTVYHSAHISVIGSCFDLYISKNNNNGPVFLPQVLSIATVVTVQSSKSLLPGHVSYIIIIICHVVTGRRRSSGRVSATAVRACFVIIIPAMLQVQTLHITPTSQFLSNDFFLYSTSSSLYVPGVATNLNFESRVFTKLFRNEPHYGYR